MPKKTAAPKPAKSFEEGLWDTATKLRGSVSMLVQSIKFGESHYGNKKDFSDCGLINAPTTSRLGRRDLFSLKT